MKSSTSIVFFFFLFLNFSLFSQNSEGQYPERIMEMELYVETPPVDSYKILKNQSGTELDSQIIYLISSKRKNEDFLWIVDENIEILIYKFN